MIKPRLLKTPQTLKLGIIPTDALMKILQLICLSFLFLLSSCDDANQGLSVKQEPTEEKSPPSLYIAKPSFLDYSDYAIIPIGILAESGKFSGYDSELLSQVGWLSSSVIHLSGNRLITTNILFYDPTTNVVNPLLDKKAIITELDYLYEENEESIETPQLLAYAVIEDDTNQDGILNRRDATILYLSDLSGNELQQISPNETQIQFWEYIPKLNSLLFKVREDRDQNNNFNSAQDAERGYIYQFTTQKITPLNTTETHFLDWTIDEINHNLLVRIQEDTDSNEEFNEQDAVNLVKVELDNPQEKIPFLHQEMSESLYQLTFD